MISWSKSISRTFGSGTNTSSAWLSSERFLHEALLCRTTLLLHTFFLTAFGLASTAKPRSSECKQCLLRILPHGDRHPQISHAHGHHRFLEKRVIDRETSCLRSPSPERHMATAPYTTRTPGCHDQIRSPSVLI